MPAPAQSAQLECERQRGELLAIREERVSVLLHVEMGRPAASTASVGLGVVTQPSAILSLVRSDLGTVIVSGRFFLGRGFRSAPQRGTTWSRVTLWIVGEAGVRSPGGQRRD